MGHSLFGGAGAPAARASAVAEVLVGAAEGLPPGQRILLIDEETGLTQAALTEAGHKVSLWRRYAGKGIVGRPWPAAGEADVVMLRFPRAREAQAFALDAAASRLVVGGTLFVVGANDEGIKSAGDRIATLFTAVESVDARRHCRLLKATRPAEVPALRGSLEAWKKHGTMDILGEERPWVSYPGLFAQGGLDQGSALLAAHLPALPPNAIVFDFGCGTGVLSAALRAKVPGVQLQMLDHDAIAIIAARENVPGAMAICGLSMGALPLWQRYHAIISNPPLHQGKDRTLAPLTELLQAAPSRLIDEGKLILVVQRHEPLQKPLQELFLNVALLAEDSRYRVWCASKPHAWVLAPEAPAEEAAEERPRRKKRRED